VTTTKPTSLTTDIALLLSIGVVLGLAYNALGLREGNGWGIAWKGVDRVEELKKAPMIGAVQSSASTFVSDDPLAVPAMAETALPEIPDYGRPVQINIEAVKQLYDASAVVLVDAREAWEYDEGHIPGSISLPYEEAITDPVRLEALDTGGRPIVTYCGGGSCEVSLSLAQELIYAGHPRIAVYMGGFPEWITAGYPVEAGEKR